MKHLTIVMTLVIGLFAVAQNVEAVVIVDDSSKGFSASTNWLSGSSPQAYGGTYRYRTTGPFADPATWKGYLPASGPYSVSAWWIAGANRTTSAPYIITHAGGSTTVNVNQQVNGAQWNLLGNFNFNAGSNTIKLSPWTATGYIIIADAVKWQ